ncbi:MAG TPA: hypothetical protein VJN94_08665 [Candidatus Binataceae bacterium]|nr:hypothetical protein [Candidatus Binataceae bacterium]
MTREWRYVILAMAAGVVGGFVGGKLSAPGAATAAEATLKVVAAQQILLVDEKGDQRGSLHLNKSGDPGFSLYDHTGKLRSDLEIGSDDDWGLKLFDPSGAMRMSMIVSAERIPAFRIYDAQARQRILVGVDSDGEPALDFYSAEGKLLRELP